MSESPIIKSLISLNDVFMQNESFGDEKNPEIFSYVDNKTHICLCAPHATKTFVTKEIKAPDLYTGAIVQYIGQKHRFSYITRNKFTPYKALVTDFISSKNLEHHFFLDIHGMKNHKSFDLAVGTGYLPKKAYRQILEIIDFLAKTYNISYVVNHKNYTGKPGLTGRLQEKTKKPSAIQLEFSKNYRDIFAQPSIVQKSTVPFILRLAKALEKTNLD